VLNVVIGFFFLAAAIVVIAVWLESYERKEMALNRGPFFQSLLRGGVDPLIIVDARIVLGNVYFVSSTHANKGDTDGRGQTPDDPFATLDYAVGKCTANQGDLIIALPGHVETVSSAGLLDLDVAGITLQGIGQGSLQPKIDFTTAATADVDIDAANITMRGFTFEASFADLAAVVDVNAADFTIEDCRFLAPVTDENALIWILGATANTSPRIIVRRCWFQDKDAQNTHAISLPGTSDGCIIEHNVFHGFYETAAIGAAGAVTNILIRHNLIQNTDTDADACINLAASSTGIIAYNGVGAALAGDATTNITASTGVVLIENYSVDTGDRQGVLDPIAT
jgi:hypothetical protein